MLLVERGLLLKVLYPLVSVGLSLALFSVALAQHASPPDLTTRTAVELPLPPVSVEALTPAPFIAPFLIESAPGQDREELLDQNAEACWPELPIEGPSRHHSLWSSSLRVSSPRLAFPDISLLSDFDDRLSDTAKPDLRGPRETADRDWTNTGLQSLFFLGIMHSWRLAVEPDTRAGLSGPFFKDYWHAIRQLRGWSDGDSFLTNYIGHPMMGAVSGRIWLQNSPRARAIEPGFNREYLKSRLKAFAFSTIFSLQFEVGLISEGAIGNATPNEYSRHPFSYIDIAITPSVGTAWLVGEDLLDRYVIRYLESKTNNFVLRVVFRGILNPTRSFSNLLRLKKPWYRDDRSF